LLSYIHTQKAVYRERIRENWRERIIERRESQGQNQRERSRQRIAEIEAGIGNQSEREKQTTQRIRHRERSGRRESFHGQITTISGLENCLF